jgi:hypothetical protein
MAHPRFFCGTTPTGRIRSGIEGAVRRDATVASSDAKVLPATAASSAEQLSSFRTWANRAAPQIVTFLSSSRFLSDGNRPMQRAAAM